MTDERWVFFTPQQMRVAHGDAPDPSVILMLDVSSDETGLAPGVRLGMRMSPTEARALAQSLVRKADDAEAGLPRA